MGEFHADLPVPSCSAMRATSRLVNFAHTPKTHIREEGRVGPGRDDPLQRSLGDRLTPQKSPRRGAKEERETPQESV